MRLVLGSEGWVTATNARSITKHQMPYEWTALALAGLGLRLGLMKSRDMVNRSIANQLIRIGSATSSCFATCASSKQLKALSSDSYTVIIDLRSPAEHLQLRFRCEVQLMEPSQCSYQTIPNANHVNPPIGQLVAVPLFHLLPGGARVGQSIQRPIPWFAPTSGLQFHSTILAEKGGIAAPVTASCSLVARVLRCFTWTERKIELDQASPSLDRITQPLI